MSAPTLKPERCDELLEHRNVLFSCALDRGHDGQHTDAREEMRWTTCGDGRARWPSDVVERVLRDAADGYESGDYQGYGVDAMRRAAVLRDLADHRDWLRTPSPAQPGDMAYVQSRIAEADLWRDRYAQMALRADTAEKALARATPSPAQPGSPAAPGWSEERAERERVAALEAASALVKLEAKVIPEFYPMYGMGGGTPTEARAQDAWSAKYGELARYIRTIRRVLPAPPAAELAS